MKIFKRFLFSDVGAGYIHVADVTTNCPTTISAKISVTTSFNAPSVIVYLKFDPISGSDKSIGRQVTSADGYAYPMSNGGGQDNIYTEVNGEILVRLVQDTVTPTQGEAIVMIEVETLPIS
jgi:type 1 fimbria pilin